ncbi:MFS transporter [Catellicoccus marimammalium]|uniref:Major facilitator superfamily (MFS) profile domain-containing protein n=1 Tax=Catellicoccus marimammalium M35/04/3 TaxID=1234409 RepID=K8ZPQ7_9ENTE|nr:MFS transporter [Catellicoccus marimammalium]EKU27531.1 hypothetical protein C683_0525 [Catellicoccus marimammalium M35/04/3]
MIDEQWNHRFKKNCYIFIFSYAVMGMVTGITNNTFFSYLDLVAPNIVKGMGMYTAISSALVSILLLFVHKIGYKKTLIVSAVASAIALAMCVIIHQPTVIAVMYIISFVGIAMFDYTYPLLLTSYVPDDQQVTMFSRTMYINLLTQAVVTFFGGKWVVAIFSHLLHVSYDKASYLSENPSALTAAQRTLYIHSYEKIVYIAVALVVVAAIACFFLKEKQSDYQEQEGELQGFEGVKREVSMYKQLFTKDILLWMLYLVIIQIGASIITPYFPIYLNNFLHIGRGTVSTILSLQTLAMVIGYLLAPWLEKKLGAIGSIGGLLILVIPLLLIMPHGAMFGAQTPLIIGVILFFRSGLANASMPIQQSLQMNFVRKDLRPAFSSFMTIVYAIAAFFTGIFTRYFLFVRPEGYGNAYYITSVMYTIGTILIYVVFFKKYNRILSKKNKEEDPADEPVKAEATEE